MLQELVQLRAKRPSPAGGRLTLHSHKRRQTTWTKRDNHGQIRRSEAGIGEEEVRGCPARKERGLTRGLSWRPPTPRPLRGCCGNPTLALSSSRGSRCDAAELVRHPPSSNGLGEIIPERGGKIRDGDTDAITISCGVVKPFCRGKIEAEASRVPDWKARSAQIVAHLCSSSPRCCLLKRLRAV